MKMKNYYICLLGAALAFSGCKKELDLKPTDSIDPSKAFQTINDIQLGTNAVYGDYGTFINQMYVGALLSDELKVGADNQGQGLFTFKYQDAADGTTGGDVIAPWAGFYTLIDQSNRVLAAVDGVTSASPFEESRRGVLKGQLLAMRAVGHFELLQDYAKKYDPADPLGVPIMLKSDPLGQPARAKVADVITQIKADFAAALALLPATTTANFTDTVMNPVTIAAYQARLAMYMNDYTNAVNYTTTVINSNVKPITSGAAFTGIWTDANTNETLFRIRFATGTTVGAVWTTTGALVYFQPSNKLISQYANTDIRLATYVGTGNGSGNGVGAGKLFVNKFFTSSKGSRVLDLKGPRIAEMYLIRAEANAQLNTAASLAAAAADLNLVRTNRITGYTNQVFADQPTLLAAILIEKYKELAFEGIRFQDLKRNGQAVSRLLTDVDSPTWQTLPANDFHFTLPIPQTELLANKNMVQNPGY